MTAAVLDASAVLALLRREPGDTEAAEALIAGATISTVNLAEVATVLTRRGGDSRKLLEPVTAQLDVAEFTLTDAYAAAELYPATRSAGLSLGDRVCLVLAERLDAPALTTDRAWLELDLEAKVHCIRPN